MTNMIKFIAEHLGSLQASIETDEDAANAIVRAARRIAQLEACANRLLDAVNADQSQLDTASSFNAAYSAMTNVLSGGTPTLDRLLAEERAKALEDAASAWEPGGYGTWTERAIAAWLRERAAEQRKALKNP